MFARSNKKIILGSLRETWQMKFDGKSLIISLWIIIKLKFHALV